MVGEQEGRRLLSGERVQCRQCQTLGQARAGGRDGSVALVRTCGCECQPPAYYRPCDGAAPTNPHLRSARWPLPRRCSMFFSASRAASRGKRRRFQRVSRVHQSLGLAARAGGRRVPWCRWVEGAGCPAAARLPLICNTPVALPGKLAAATAGQRAPARRATCAAATAAWRRLQGLTLCCAGRHHGIGACRCRAEAAETRAAEKEGRLGGGTKEPESAG